MFWRFGFNAGSSIDSLLDKEDVSLEAILDEDDLLQECKAQNTRLIDYFQRKDVLQKLLAYVSGSIEIGEDEDGHFKYPHTATEVLCSEIWSIVETCVNEQKTLLAPFWQSVLDRPPDEIKTEVIMASRFAKVNAIFLQKKPAEMLAFIQSLPSVVERLVCHIENQAFVDILVRIIQTDGQLGGVGVLEWLSSQNLMGRLIDLLGPEYPPDVHQVSAELIKGIIAMATPSPSEGIPNAPTSNRFARELAHKNSISRLAGYMLQDYGPGKNVAPSPDDGSSIPPLSPTFESRTSSVIESIGVIVELIRKNNSDYFEPYLFHTLRNKLIQVQAGIPPEFDETQRRERLEGAMKEITDGTGVVHLGAVLEIMREHLETIVGYLKNPRSADGPMATTVGKAIPLTFERYRICELVAELLHCSNMSILNRPTKYDRLYDFEGRLQGGLPALEDLAHVIQMNNRDGGSGKEEEPLEAMEEGEIEPALELPVSGSHASTTSTSSSLMLDSDDDEMDSDDAMEEIAMYDEPEKAQSPPGDVPATTPSPRSPSSPTISLRKPGSRRSSKRMGSMDVSSSTVSLNPPQVYIGERMKACLLKTNVLSTLMDLFYEFPWNNFLHSAVYDVIHQILTGNIESGNNRELAITLFRDARLMHRIVDMQKLNDIESAKPKGVRLGYMGHLTLISEDVLLALESFPPDLKLALRAHAPDPEWNEYVHGRYSETKIRDSALLGGGKPVLGASGAAGAVRGKWKVDEAEPNTLTLSSPGPSPTGSVSGGGMNGEFTRSATGKPRRESSADFGPAPMSMDNESDDDDHDAAPHISRYLHNSRYDDEDDEDDDEGGGWLSRTGFTLGNPPVTAAARGGERRPLDGSPFDDNFASTPSSLAPTGRDPFDDDGFGPFTSTTMTSTFSASFHEDFDDSFGDFGEFQSGGGGEDELGDGQLTPTGSTSGSWTFASGSEGSGGSLSPSPMEGGEKPR